MDDIASLFSAGGGGGAAAAQAERLDVLRVQRMRLAALIDELVVAAAGFRMDDGARDRTWRSHASRVYAARRGDLQAEIDRTVAAMHDALASVERAISELRAAE